MCSNEVLRERIESLKKNVENMGTKLDGFIQMNLEWQAKLLEKMDNRYPTRREFNAVKVVMWVVSTIFGIIIMVSNFVK